MVMFSYSFSGLFKAFSEGNLAFHPWAMKKGVSPTCELIDVLYAKAKSGNVWGQSFPRVVVEIISAKVRLYRSHCPLADW
ncbi:unnamed protein product [Meloidogyne enterolobii]|uniref:Uncharacterized protein n=1 Tax=Meloidogyne enterolobii TaxID=390850 RepID=A0ACB0YJU5_MELEN